MRICKEKYFDISQKEPRVFLCLKQNLVLVELREVLHHPLELHFIIFYSILFIILLQNLPIHRHYKAWKSQGIFLYKILIHQGWLRVSKSWGNFNFWVKYPFNLS